MSCRGLPRNTGRTRTLRPGEHASTNNPQLPQRWSYSGSQSQSLPVAWPAQEAPREYYKEARQCSQEISFRQQAKAEQKADNGHIDKVFWSLDHFQSHIDQKRI